MSRSSLKNSKSYPLSQILVPDSKRRERRTCLPRKISLLLTRRTSCSMTIVMMAEPNLVWWASTKPWKRTLPQSLILYTEEDRDNNILSSFNSRQSISQQSWSQEMWLTDWHIRLTLRPRNGRDVTMQRLTGQYHDLLGSEGTGDSLNNLVQPRYRWIR